MDKTFNVTINLGNAAMQTGQDIGKALTNLSNGVFGIFNFTTNDSGVVKDTNGNTVGTWQVNEQSNMSPVKYYSDDAIEQHVTYLEGTLIPDLQESGSDATAEDFQTSVDMIKWLLDEVETLVTK